MGTEKVGTVCEWGYGLLNGLWWNRGLPPELWAGQ